MNRLVALAKLGDCSGRTDSCRVQVSQTAIVRLQVLDGTLWAFFEIAEVFLRKLPRRVAVSNYVREGRLEPDSLQEAS